MHPKTPGKTASGEAAVSNVTSEALNPHEERDSSLERQGGLSAVYKDIANRVEMIVERRPAWPCAKGCSGCCRALAEPLRLPTLEWHRLFEAMKALPKEQRLEVEERLRALVRQDERPYTCAFLDLESGACRVYEARPSACRAYGFYVDRDGGRYCGLIETFLEENGDQDIVWGNHQALDREMTSQFGAFRTLREIWPEYEARD